MNITGIILAGGKSSRMGTDKGLAQINGKPMISYVINSMKLAGISEIIIVANNLDYRQFGLPVYPDVIKDKGPLGGIYTGLLKSQTVKNLILSCDVPFVDEKILRFLIENSSDELISVVSYQDHVHHLIGMYDASLISSLGEHLLENKLKVKCFNDKHTRKVLELKKSLLKTNNHSLSNVNTMEELKKLEHGM